jgi:hypothetical protein
VIYEYHSNLIHLHHFDEARSTTRARRVHRVRKQADFEFGSQGTVHYRMAPMKAKLLRLAANETVVFRQDLIYSKTLFKNLKLFLFK